MTDTNKQIESLIQSFVSELTTLVREAALDAVQNALNGKSAAPRATRAPAAKPAVAAAPARAPVAKPAKGRKGKRIRRTPEQIAAVVETVYGFIKKNPNQRTEKIRAALGFDPATMRDALDRLMGDKKLKMKGVKRAATYTVAL